MEKLTLKKPLPIGGGDKKLEELKFRDHTIADDYLAFDKRGGVAQNIALIASITGTDEELVRRLHGKDYRAATKIIDKMLADDGDVDGESAEKKPSES